MIEQLTHLRAVLAANHEHLLKLIHVELAVGAVIIALQVALVCLNLHIQRLYRKMADLQTKRLNMAIERIELLEMLRPLRPAAAPAEPPAPQVLM